MPPRSTVINNTDFRVLNELKLLSAVEQASGDGKGVSKQMKLFLRDAKDAETFENDVKPVEDFK